MLSILILLSLILWTGCKKKGTDPEPVEITADYYAPRAAEAPTINGQADEDCWDQADWAEINYLWLGNAEADPQDFSGKYKIVWTAEKLYFLFEITDNVLSDIYNDPLDRYYMDDCLEIFVDEDHSGGDHQCNYNAFAYHIALDYQAVDLGISCNPRLLTDHLDIMRTSSGNRHTWEIGMNVYTDAYNEVLGLNSSKAELQADKSIGYATAYCDDDGQGVREHFYGSVDIPGEDKNVAWHDASVFGTVLLVD